MTTIIWAPGSLSCITLPVLQATFWLHFCLPMSAQHMSKTQPRRKLLFQSWLESLLTLSMVGKNPSSNPFMAAPYTTLKACITTTLNPSLSGISILLDRFLFLLHFCPSIHVLCHHVSVVGQLSLGTIILSSSLEQQRVRDREVRMIIL